VNFSSVKEYIENFEVYLYMSSYDIEDQRNIVTTTCVILLEYIRKMRVIIGMNLEAMLMKEVAVIVKKT
jgi:hypothetical protein